MAVNRVANDGPALIAPYVEPPASPDVTVAAAPGAPVKRARKPKLDDRQSSLF
jgi:hypothetical protein